MKKAAKSLKEPTTTLVTTAIGEASIFTAPELPDAHLLARTVRRVRQHNNPQFQTPQSLADLDIPNEYKQTDKGEPFLYYDSEGDKKRFLIYTTERNLDRLTTCKIWQCDGTFRSVPTIFTQLYTLHGHIDGKLVPLVYVLLPGKTLSLYKKVLQIIKKGRPNMKPQIIISDFEQAFISAAEKVFPRAEFHGCYFHFTQCIYRHVQSSGLQSRYGTDEDFAISIKMLAALAFIPEEIMTTAYDQLKHTEYYQANKKGVLKPIIAYFEDTWIGKKKRNQRTRPIFDISLWNCFSAIMNDGPRTNNQVEGWHNGFNQRVSKSHATMGKFLTTIKQEQSVTESVWENYLAGRVVAPPKRRKYVKYDQRIKRAATNFDPENDVVEYLRGQSHNVKF